MRGYDNNNSLNEPPPSRKLCPPLSHKTIKKATLMHLSPIPRIKSNSLHSDRSLNTTSTTFPPNIESPPHLDIPTIVELEETTPSPHSTQQINHKHNFTSFSSNNPKDGLPSSTDHSDPETTQISPSFHNDHLSTIKSRLRARKIKNYQEEFQMDTSDKDFEDHNSIQFSEIESDSQSSQNSFKFGTFQMPKDSFQLKSIIKQCNTLKIEEENKYFQEQYCEDMDKGN